MEQALSIHNLAFTYKSWNGKPNSPLFDNLSLTLEEGSKTLLLAPFNLGKSTLARIICGLCPKYADGELGGNVEVFGKDVHQGEPWELLLDCGYVSQNPQEQFVATSVEDEIAFPLESLGLDQKEIASRLGKALTQWGLQTLKTCSEQELSGGERKRVLLAVQAAIQPRLWLLDEAFDDLDEAWRVVLRQTIEAQQGTTLVLASRYLEEFSTLFDQVLLLKDGRIVEGSLDALLSDFKSLCGDDLPNPITEKFGNITPVHELVCAQLKAERRRVSTLEASLFELGVPSFVLRSGELVTLVGPNGSGKSSFSRVLCGLDAPVQGTISIDGESLEGRYLGRKVGYLFQNPDLQIFLPTVEEELSWSLRRRKDLNAAQVKTMVEECASLFGLDLQETPATMSYPLRKALQGAVYYLLDRPFYILDELDSALTYHEALQIIARLRRNGAGIMIITHDKQFAALVSQRNYRIVEGRLVQG